MKKILILVSILLLISCVAPCPPGHIWEECKGRCIQLDTFHVAETDTVRMIESAKITEEFKPKKLIPSFTPFKISDVVCVWGKDEGVVIRIKYGIVPEGHEDVLVYSIQFPGDKEDGDYYETELKKGKCNSY